MLSIFLTHQWKGFWRSRNKAGSIAAQVMLFFFMLYFLGIAVYLGVQMRSIIEQFFPGRGMHAGRLRQHPVQIKQDGVIVVRRNRGDDDHPASSLLAMAQPARLAHTVESTLDVPASLRAAAPSVCRCVLIAATEFGGLPAG